MDSLSRDKKLTRYSLYPHEIAPTFIFVCRTHFIPLSYIVLSTTILFFSFNLNHKLIIFIPYIHSFFPIACVLYYSLITNFATFSIVRRCPNDFTTFLFIIIFFYYILHSLSFLTYHFSIIVF